MAKDHTTFIVGIVLPRTSIWMFFVLIVMLIHMIICFLCLCDFVDSSSWRWVLCGLTLAYSLIFLISLIATFIQMRREVWRDKKKDYKTFPVYVQLQNSFYGFIMFLFTSVFWATFMGVKTDVQFLITISITNYIILKMFYLLNINIVFALLLTHLNFPVDILYSKNWNSCTKTGNQTNQKKCNKS